MVRRSVDWELLTTDVSDVEDYRDQLSLKMCRPWRQNRDDSSTELHVLAKRNYKVVAYFGRTGEPLTRELTVLDTGAGHNFIRLSTLSAEARRAIRHSRIPDIRDANKGRVRTMGMVTLRCQLGSYQVRVDFVVCERLSVPVILGCDFCDRYVEAIMPRRKTVELDDGTTIPIVRAPSTRARDAVPLPEAYRKPIGADPPDPKIKATRPYTVQPGTQTWVEVRTRHHGVGIVEPLPMLYERYAMAAANGVVSTEPEKPFRILVANFSNSVRYIKRNQVVGHVLPHPQTMSPSRLHTSEMLGIVESTSPITSDIEDEDPDEQPMHHAKKDDVTSADDLDLSHVPEKYREKLRSMLHEFRSMYDGRLGGINTTEHAIDLVPGTRPIHANPYREGPKMRDIVKDEVERQLRAGVIEPSQSAWASPVIIVPKPDGTPRFCVDYRRLNAVTVRDSYPLPRMDDCIDSLGEAAVFTTLDAYSGYWQVPIRKEDQELTSFTCHRGTYKYLRMPFGLSNAPATFQRVLDIVLSRYRWQTCLVYLDDVIIFSKNMDDHVKHVREVLTALRDAGVTLKLKNCEFFKDSVRYLGHVIRPGRLEVDLARIAALNKAQHPRNHTELRSFLGLCNVYRRFIRNFTHMAAPLYDMLKKGKPTKFDSLSEEAAKAFDALIEKVTNPPVLALPRADLPYSIDTDASDYQLGVALFQHLPDGTRQTLGYWSRTLQAAEKNYSTPEKECLAVVWACTVLRPYLQGAPFMVHTDQASLRWLLSTTDGTGRLMRWRLRLSEFDFEVKYKKGSTNSVADCLSRLSTRGETVTEIDDEIPCFVLDEEQEQESDGDPPCEGDAWEDFDLALVAEGQDGPRPVAITTEELIREQARDTFCQALRARLDKGDLIPFEEDGGGVLVRTVESSPQIVVPRTLVPRVLALAHRPPNAAHPGEVKLYQTLRRHFYWTTLSVDAVTTVKNCVSCARNRVKLRRNSHTLKLFPASGPLEFVAIDILGPLIRTSRGNRFLLVISDRFSKLTRTVPMSRVTEAAVAKAFTTHWAFTYGPPSILLSDNGKQFAARLFVHVCRLMGTDNVFTSTYHPQTNGQVERFNRTLLAALRHYVLDHPRDWDEFTPVLTYAYNSQIHRTTGFAPFELTLARPPPHLALQVRPDLSAVANRASAYQRWRLRLQALLKTASASSDAARARYKRDFDRRLRRNPEHLVPGMYVFVRREYAPKTDSSEPRKHKLSPVTDGAFKILSVDDKTVVIDDDHGNQERISRDRVVKAPVTDDNVAPASYDPRTPLSVQPTEAGPPPAHIVQAPRATTAGESSRTTGTPTMSPVEVLRQLETDLGIAPGALVTAVHNGPPAHDTVAAPTDVPEHTPEPTVETPRLWRDVLQTLSRDAGVDPSLPIRALTPSSPEPSSTPVPRTRAVIAPPVPGPATGLIPQGDPVARVSRTVTADPTSQAARSDLQPDVSQSTRDTVSRRTASRTDRRPLPSVAPRRSRRQRTPSRRLDNVPGEASTQTRRTRPERLYVVDKLVDHGVANVGPVYLVRWQDCDKSADTWEPLKHLRRSQVIRYHRRRRLPPPTNLDDCLEG